MKSVSQAASRDTFNGLLIDPFEAIFVELGCIATFADAVLTAAKLGEDLDTTAAIAL